MTQHGISLAIEFAIQTVFLLLALWIMIKLQKLHWNLPGMIGAAALASGLDMIPYVGHYISFSVLLLCVWKLSQPDSYTDVIFTVGIGYALMFCMNLFLLGALMGDMKPLTPVKADSKPADGEVRPADTANETNQATVETVHATEPKEKAEPVNSTTNQPAVAQATENNAPTPAQQPDPKTNDVNAPLLALNMVSKFKLIGISGGANHALAMIRTGTKTESVSRNESIQVETAKGWVAVRCEAVEEHKVVLNVAGQKITLSMY
jgi:hypothetical protein